MSSPDPPRPLGSDASNSNDPMKKGPAVTEASLGLLPSATSGLESSASFPAQWPPAPARLTRMDYRGYAVLAWDIIITLLPLVFLVFAGVGAKLDGQPLSLWGSQVRSAANLGPTIFPIVFAIQMRRMLRFVARWRAERGATLGTLEQLMGSLSIFGTVETNFLLRASILVGLGLFVLWALSPLGGQASLRLVGTAEVYRYSDRKVWYVAKEEGDNNFLGTGSGQAEWGTAARALYQASLLAPSEIQTAPQDTWGNVKIPYLEKLDASATDPDGWISVPATNASYSSLLGVPVTGLQVEPLMDFSHFTMETQYFTLDCPRLAMIMPNERINTSTVRGEGYAGSNTSAMGVPTSGLGGWPTFSLLTNTNWTEERNSDPNLGPRNVLWQSLGYNNYTLANCTMALSHVESNVTCSKRQCQVNRIRASRRPHPPSNLTPFDTNFVIAQNFLSTFPYITISSRSTVSSPTEAFIGGTSRPFETPNDRLGLYDLPPDVFAQRLTMCWNTYWQATVMPEYQTGGLPTDWDAFERVERNGSLYADGSLTPLVPYRANSSVAHLIQYETRYVCYRAWLGILIVSSIVLVLSGLIGTVAKYYAAGPELLHFVSTLTRDNPYIPLPPGGTTMDGLDRARWLKNLKVRVQDVRPNDEIGQIAFVAADGPYAGLAGSLKRGRRYI